MRRLGTLPAQWFALLIASAAIGAAPEWIRVPAALLLGPMLAGIAAGASVVVRLWSLNTELPRSRCSREKRCSYRAVALKLLSP